MTCWSFVYVRVHVRVCVCTRVCMCMYVCVQVTISGPSTTTGDGELIPPRFARIYRIYGSGRTSFRAQSVSVNTQATFNYHNLQYSQEIIHEDIPLPVSNPVRQPYLPSFPPPDSVVYDENTNTSTWTPQSEQEDICDPTTCTTHPFYEWVSFAHRFNENLRVPIQLSSSPTDTTDILDIF